MDPGISDHEVLNLANNEQAVLLTADNSHFAHFYVED
jgi:hypothetical protein